MKEHYQTTVSPFQSPQSADFDNILFLDLTHNHLVHTVSGLLKQEYLVPYQNSSQTATGHLFGYNARPMICLPVQPLGKQGKSLSVHFLVDTGSPISYISQQALLTIFSVQNLALIDSTGVNIWGTKQAISRSIAHWQGINLLGANYLRKAQLSFQCYYSDDPELEICKLVKRG